MSQDAADEGSLSDGGKARQGAWVTARTALHVDGEDPFEPPGPAKARGNRASGRPDALLSRCWNDAAPQLTINCAGYRLEYPTSVDYVSSRIARFKRPKRVEFTDALPQAEDGSIDRDAVKATWGD